MRHADKRDENRLGTELEINPESQHSHRAPILLKMLLAPAALPTL